MAEGKHTFTKTGSQHQPSYATLCQWIVETWGKISISSVAGAFTKAGIMTEQLNNKETDSDNDERDTGVLDAEIAQLLKLRH